MDHIRELELAAISGGGEIVPGEMVDKFDEWLIGEPEPFDHEKAQLFAALGVGPPA